MPCKINQNNPININAFQQCPTFPNESLFQMRHARLGTVLQLLSFFCRFFSVNFSGEINNSLKSLRTNGEILTIFDI